MGRSPVSASAFRRISARLIASIRPTRTVRGRPYDQTVFTFEVVGDGQRPPWWRTVPYLLLGVFCVMLSSSMSPAAWAMTHGDDPATFVVLCAWLCGLAFGVLLFWRHRFPFALTVAASVLSLVIPIGNSFAWGYLACLIGRRRGRAVWASAGLVAVTSTAVVVLDSLAQPRGASLMASVFDFSTIPDAPGYVPVWAIIAISLLGMALSIGSGLLVRAQRESASAQRKVQTAQAASDRLGDEVARSQERERIAREVHDALGHRLSLLTLHAGALEANAGDDPQVHESARLVRESAGAAMADLRSLLSLLHDPSGGEAPQVSLAQLSEIVRDSFGTGQPVSSSILIQNPEDAHPALTRAVYRIVQELLTNARKHAPEQPVFLVVEGGPASGISIDCQNAYVGGWESAAPGDSRGLKGITERAELLHGTVKYGLDGDKFRVHVDLPWSAAEV